MVISQGEVWWADLGDPVGSGPGFRRPVLVVQGDALNRTSQLKWADAVGNVKLSPRETGLPKPSVANASQVVALDRRVLRQRVGKVSTARLAAILAGIDIVLGRGAG